MNIRVLLARLALAIYTTINFREFITRTEVAHKSGESFLAAIHE